MDEMRWVPIPNKHDGDGYIEMVDGPDGAAILGCWLGIIQVASKCHPRGTLVKEGGIPHTAESISKKIRLPSAMIQKALDRACSKLVNWLEVVSEVAVSDTDTQACQASDKSVSPDHQEADSPPTTRVRARSVPFHSIPFPSKVGVQGEGETPGDGLEKMPVLILAYLNEKAGRGFEPVPENLKFIKSRLKEVDSDLDGIKKMIDRQVEIWKGTDQEQYLRPSTLFNSAKFRGYYDDRSQPTFKFQKNGHVANHRVEKAAGEFQQEPSPVAFL